MSNDVIVVGSPKLPVDHLIRDHHSDIDIVQAEKDHPFESSRHSKSVQMMQMVSMMGLMSQPIFGGVPNRTPLPKIGKSKKERSKRKNKKLSRRRNRK